jgi:hypothetical protein
MSSKMRFSPMSSQMRFSPMSSQMRVPSKGDLPMSFK